MKKTSSFFFFLFLSVLFIIVQTTFLSPAPNTYLYPDLNAIIILILAILKHVPGSIFLVIGNGYLMDVMSGYMIGIHTISRLIPYLVIRNSAKHIDYKNLTPQIFALFFGNISMWVIVWLTLKTRLFDDINISLEIIIHQATINTVVGLPMYWIIKEANERIQK